MAYMGPPYHPPPCVTQARRERAAAAVAAARQAKLDAQAADGVNDFLFRVMEAGGVEQPLLQAQQTAPTDPFPVFTKEMWQKWKIFARCFASVISLMLVVLTLMSDSPDKAVCVFADLLIVGVAFLFTQGD